MRGDVIYVIRYKMPTDGVIYMRDREGLYRHYGVDVGSDQVIHFRNYSGESKNSARIILTSKSEFAKGDTIEKSYTTQYLYDEDEIVDRAYSKLGSSFEGYDLINNNCEHFANWCASGKKTSLQVFFRNDDQDVVEKAIDRAFEPLIKFGKSIDKLFGWD